MFFDVQFLLALTLKPPERLPLLQNEAQNNLFLIS